MSASKTHAFEDEVIVGVCLGSRQEELIGAWGLYLA